MNVNVETECISEIVCTFFRKIRVEYILLRVKGAKTTKMANVGVNFGSTRRENSSRI